MQPKAPKLLEDIRDAASFDWTAENFRLDDPEICNRPLRSAPSLRRMPATPRRLRRCGVVPYDGEQALSFGSGLLAAPIRALWEAVASSES